MSDKVRLTVLKDGPIVIDGLVKVTYNGVDSETDKCYICRCGASKKKPYCDGSHRKIDFKD